MKQYKKTLDSLDLHEFIDKCINKGYIIQVILPRGTCYIVLYTKE